MPEGAEVKRCGDYLRQTLQGRAITRAEARSGKLLRAGVRGAENLVLPATVENVTVKGKVIAIMLRPLNDRPEQYLISTLGMSGWWYPLDVGADGDRIAYVAGVGPRRVADVINQATKYNRFELIADGGGAFYSDMRNFGNLYVTDQAGFLKKLGEIGPDLSGTTLPLGELVQRLLLLGRSQEIGQALLNQKALSGLGNIYRAETLYLAGISPFRRVSSLAREELENVILAAKQVLFYAYQHDGLMQYSMKMLLAWLSPSLGEKLQGQVAVPEGKKLEDGRFQRHLVYSRHRDIMGHAVRSDPSAGRTIWWVPEVQK